jgi:hypothetical protein
VTICTLCRFVTYGQFHRLSELYIKTHSDIFVVLNMQLRVSPIVNGGKCLSTFHIFRWPFLFMIYDYWLRSRREQRDILQAVLNTWRQFEIAISLFQEDRLVMKDKQSV